jgi:hypothetical protein
MQQKKGNDPTTLTTLDEHEKKSESMVDGRPEVGSRKLVRTTPLPSKIAEKPNLCKAYRVPTETTILNAYNLSNACQSGDSTD